MDFFKKNIFAILTVLGVLLLIVQALFLSINPFSGVIDLSSGWNFGGDHRSYYFAGKHFLAGDDIYYSDLQVIKFAGEPQQSFVYPPLMAVFFVPLGFLPLFSSYIFLSVLSITLLFLSLLFLSKNLPKSKLFIFWTSVALLSSPILALHMDRGQTDIVILFLVAASFLALFKKKSIFSGILVGLAASLKVTPLIFLPYLFIRDRMAFWSSVVTIVVISACFGVDVWVEFLARIHDFSNSVSSGNLSNSFLGVFANKYLFDYYSYATISLACAGVLLLILSFTFFFIYKNSAAQKFVLLEYGVISTFMIIIPSVAWAYNGVHSLFLLAGYWSIRFNGSLNKWVYFFFDILVYLLISQPLLSPFVRDFPIYHIFSLRPLMYLCFVALFIYIIHKEKIHAYIANFKLTKFYTASFVRFCIVGFVGTASNLLVFYLVSKVANINIGAVVAFTFAVTQNYILNHSWSFRLHNAGNFSIKSYYRYVFVNLFGLSLNLFVLNILAGLGLNTLLAQAIGVIAGMSLNYIGSYFFVFVRRANA